MGMYTEIYVNVDLKENTPKEVIDTLCVMCGDDDWPSDWPHPKRWLYLFNNGSYYTANTSAAELTFDDISQQWSLIGKGDIKNYNNEIQAFFEFISPWVDPQSGDKTFIGYMRFEESAEPELFYVKDSDYEN